MEVNPQRNILVMGINKNDPVVCENWKALEGTKGGRGQIT